MQIKNLWLYNFRNYNELNIEFAEGTNLIIGDNGAGKTNILEAIYYLSTSKSFRNSPDRDIKNWEKNDFAIEGDFYSEDGEIKVKFKYTNGKKELYINNLLETKITTIIGKIFVVPFLFDDIYLISGSPAKRRSFIDITLSMVDKYYFRNLRDYISAIRQKNSLLKNDKIMDRDLIKVWNEKISEYASYIIYKRREIVKFFNNIIGGLKERIYSDRFLFSIKYRSMLEKDTTETPDEIKYRVLTILNENIEKEMIMKNCLIGPHRDDFIIYKNNFTVRRFGSIGEGRVTSIILKKCQIEFYKHFKKIDPILLIDDIFLELDKEIKRLSKKMIEDKFQILLTTTSKENIPDNINYKKAFYISKGKIIKEEY